MKIILLRLCSNDNYLVYIITEVFCSTLCFNGDQRQGSFEKPIIDRSKQHYQPISEPKVESQY
jgi:hypothetical protein